MLFDAIFRSSFLSLVFAGSSHAECVNSWSGICRKSLFLMACRLQTSSSHEFQLQVLQCRSTFHEEPGGSLSSNDIMHRWHVMYQRDASGAQKQNCFRISWSRNPWKRGFVTMQVWHTVSLFPAKQHLIDYTHSTGGSYSPEENRSVYVLIIFPVPCLKFYTWSLIVLTPVASAGVHQIL